MVVLNVPPRSIRVLALALFIIFTSFYSLFHPDFGASLNGSSWGGASSRTLASHSPNPFLSRAPPNITIIAIWNPKTDSPPHPYLPNFFASVRANPKVHLLFIVFDKFHYGCDKRISPVQENIQEICFDADTYWRLHMDFLCERWGCTAQDKIPLLQTLLARSNNDVVRAVL